MPTFHDRLARDLARWFGGPDGVPDSWRGFVESVDRAYRECDAERAKLERSLDLSSEELVHSQSEARAVFARLIESSVDGIMAFDRECRFTVWNPGMERMTGITAADAVGRSAFDLFPLLKQTGDDRCLLDALSGKTALAKDRPYAAAGTDRGFFEGRYAPLFGETGAIIGGLAVFRDTTERKRAETILRKRVEQQRMAKEVGERCLEASSADEVMERVTPLIAGGADADLAEILMLDGRGDALVRVAGYGWGKHALGPFVVPAAADSQQGYTLAVNGPVVVDDLAAERRFAASSLLTEQHVVSGLSVPLVSRSRTIGVLAVYARRPRAFTVDDVEFVRSVAALIAVAIDRRRAEATLEASAIHDELTGLYNRRYFHGRFDEEMARASRGHRSLAVMLCDVDRFRSINDMRGHSAGDDVLKAVAKRLQGAVRETDLVFRWGADEIVVVLPEVAHDAVAVTADRIRRSVRQLGETLNEEVDLSIGVVLYPDHGTTSDELMRVADRALFFAKKSGDKVHIGEADYHLNDQTIEVVFQPIVDLRTREVMGYEALARDPSGKVGIVELFKRFQAIGRLRELKRLCFETQLRTARAIGLARVFLNIEFDVLRGIDPPDVPPGMEVVLEISEVEALHDVVEHLAIAKQWRKKGYQFAMDDFGAGFISLPFIGQLVPDYIKLDRSAILHAAASEGFRAFSKDLVFALKNYVRAGFIAEGIETEAELRVAHDLGISLAQGFLLGRPQPLSPGDLHTGLQRAA